jgi:hypothetical protein
MTKRVKMVRGSGNVFRDLGFREPEARNLALRSENIGTHAMTIVPRPGVL